MSYHWRTTNEVKQPWRKMGILGENVYFSALILAFYLTFNGRVSSSLLLYMSNSNRRSWWSLLGLSKWAIHADWSRSLSPVNFFFQLTTAFSLVNRSSFTAYRTEEWSLFSLSVYSFLYMPAAGKGWKQMDICFFFVPTVFLCVLKPIIKQIAYHNACVDKRVMPIEGGLLACCLLSHTGRTANGLGAKLIGSRIKARFS